MKSAISYIRRNCCRANVFLFFVILTFTGCSSLRTSSKGGNVPADVVQKYYLINGLSKYYQGDLGEAHGFLAKSISVLPNCAACYYALSNVLVKAGFMNDALNASRMAFSLDSTNFWYGKHLAQVSDFNGNVELATKTYKYLLSNFKNIKDEDIVFSLGSLYCRQNQFDEALYLYDSLQKVSGLDERIVFLKQQIYFATNNNSAALVEALRYFERNTEDPHANVLLAEVFGRSGKDSIALQYLERAHKLDQDYAAPLFNLAELYRKNYEYDKFFNILDEIAVNMNIPLSDKVEYFSFAVQFWSQIRYRDKVENLFPLLAKNNSGAWAFKQFYAAFLMQTERQKQAMEIVNEELQQNIKNVDAWNLKISMLYYAHDLENTLSALDSAVLYSRNKYTLLMQKSSVLYEMKRYKEAISILENLLKSKENEKNKKEILSILGDLYHAAGNKKEAYKVYQKVLDFDTINVGILNNYAYYLSEDNKDLKKALVMSKKTIDAQPENATFLDTYAWILHKLGRDEEAKPVFRRAMTFGGRESAVILDHYGDVLFALKEYDVAILYWEDALSKKDVANPEKIKMKIEKSKQIQNKK